VTKPLIHEPLEDTYPNVTIPITTKDIFNHPISFSSNNEDNYYQLLKLLMLELREEKNHAQNHTTTEVPEPESNLGLPTQASSCPSQYSVPLFTVPNFPELPYCAFPTPGSRDTCLGWF
jgi:hypothetical protein